MAAAFASAASAGTEPASCRAAMPATWPANEATNETSSYDPISLASMRSSSMRSKRAMVASAHPGTPTQPGVHDDRDGGRGGHADPALARALAQRVPRIRRSAAVQGGVTGTGASAAGMARPARSDLPSHGLGLVELLFADMVDGQRSPREGPALHPRHLRWLAVHDDVRSRSSRCDPRSVIRLPGRAAPCVALVRTREAR